MRLAFWFGWAVGVFLVLTGFKVAFGYGLALVVATAALSFCVGAMWDAGKHKDTTHDR